MVKATVFVALAIPLVLTGAVLTSSWVVVDVRQADGPRVIVPVPLSLARAALALAPDEAKLVEIPDIEHYQDVAEELVDELLVAPDGVLVEVDDGDDHVWIAKVDDAIEIEVDGDGEEVSISAPLEVIADILDSYDGQELATREVLAALATISSTELVHVRTEDEEVKVWIW